MLKIVKDYSLPSQFKTKANLNLLAHAIHVYEDRAHNGLRQAKTRSEVNRTTKKVYKQKGTGGARHGSRRAPIYVGGGVAHGPRAVHRVLSLSKALKAKAKSYALSEKAKEKKVFFVRGISTVVKTGEVGTFLKKQGFGKVLFVLSAKNSEKARFIKNLSMAKAILFDNLTALDIYKGGIILVDDTIFVKEKPKVKVEKKVTK